MILKIPILMLLCVGIAWGMQEKSLMQETSLINEIKEETKDAKLSEDLILYIEGLKGKIDQGIAQEENAKKINLMVGGWVYPVSQNKGVNAELRKKAFLAIQAAAINTKECKDFADRTPQNHQDVVNAKRQEVRQDKPFQNQQYPKQINPEALQQISNIFSENNEYHLQYPGQFLDASLRKLKIEKDTDATTLIAFSRNAGAIETLQLKAINNIDLGEKVSAERCCEILDIFKENEYHLVLDISKRKNQEIEKIVNVIAQSKTIKEMSLRSAQNTEEEQFKKAIQASEISSIFVNTNIIDPFYTKEK